MHIADIARQYANTTTSADSMNGTRGVEKLISSVRELSAGNIFEGTVNSISGSKVVLGLSNGTELAARLDADMQLVKGQSMFFQVKSNDGASIAIRPYTVDGAGVNLTLMNALKAAGLPATERYLNMANTMMQEHMPIDKNSMTQMARILMADPDMCVNTVVQMKKLGIPITNEMVAQFENYMDDSNAVHKAMDRFISELPTTLSGKNMPLEQLKNFDSQLLLILADGMEVHAGNEGVNNQTVLSNGAQVESGIINNTIAGLNGGQVENETAANPIILSNGAQAENEIVNNPGLSSSSSQVESEISNNPIMSLNNAAAESTSDAIIKGTVAEAVVPEANEESIATEQVSKNIQASGKVSDAQENVVKLLYSLFGDTGITSEDSSAGLLHKLANVILQGENISKEALNELFSSKDMQVFLRDVMEEQMYLTPKDVADSEKINKLYERLNSKAQRLESLLANAGLKDTPLAQTVTDVRGNIDFMNQLNQTYTYVQIPLKMSGQNASGQLYVYTNKRDLGDPDRELTAFLHLDLDHLGSTDVSVCLLRKNIDTKFYMDSDESYALVKAHMPELEERLRKKGFYASIYVENEGKKVNFVEDFLKKDAPSAGQLHRYSFDVRA